MAQFELRPCEWISPEWEIEHDVRFLVKDGRSEALEGLRKCRRDSPEDFRKIIASVRMVAAAEEVYDCPRVIRDSQGSGVFEIKAKKSPPRLFAFTDGQNTVICDYWYWKTHSSAKKQEAAFSKAREIMNEYRKWIKRTFPSKERQRP